MPHCDLQMVGKHLFVLKNYEKNIKDPTLMRDQHFPLVEEINGLKAKVDRVYCEIGTRCTEHLQTQICAVFSGFLKHVDFVFSSYRIYC